MVRIKIPVVAEQRESKKKYVPPLFAIGLLLFSSVLGVYYFHAQYNTKDLSDKYNKQWYERNSKATVPRDLLDLLRNLSDLIGGSDFIENNPELNLPQDIYSSIFPNKTVFYVRGRASPLAWKISSLTQYVPNIGWRFQPVDLVNYTYHPSSFYDFTYDVIKPEVIANTTTRLYVPTLLAGSEEISFGDISVKDINYPNPPPPALNVKIVQYKDLNSGGGVLYVDSNIGVNVSIQLTVNGIALYETQLSSYSGTLADTRDAAENDNYLSRFIGLPRDYMDNHPNVKDLADSLYLGPTATVYEQVKNVLTYLSVFFEINNQSAPEGTDPVAWFVDNGGGSPVYFLYTSALILRYYRIPTRIAVGYIIGTYKPEIDMTEFTMSEHLFLWLEVYDEGLGYWVNYNAIPYIFTELTGIPRPRNMIDVTVTPIIAVTAPRYYSGIPTVYLNETFTVLCIVPGITNPDYLGSMTIYDINISETDPIASTPFTVTEGGLVSSFTSSYEVIYLSFPSQSPLYGIHVLKIIVGSMVVFKTIALIKRVSVSP